MILLKSPLHNYCGNKAAFPITNLPISFGPMSENLQNRTKEELVDILAQKTQKFTQLLIYKDFGIEYQECKQLIQQILTEIEIRKEATSFQQNEAASA